MREVYNLDQLQNGSPGAAERFHEAARRLNANFIMRELHREHYELDISGNIPGIGDYKAAHSGDREWVEGCLTLPPCLFSTHWVNPYLIEQQTLLTGAAVNLPVRYLSDSHLTEETQETYERAIIIGGRGGAVYGHWLLDFIPQLRTALACLEHEKNDETPILVMNWPRFGHALLELAGVHHRCIFPIRHRTLQINEPILPLVTKRGRSYSVNVLRESFTFLRQKAEQQSSRREPSQAQAGAKAPANTRRLAIDRAKSPRGANYDAVLAELGDRGFKTLRPEQLSVTEQIEHFSHADLIVGEDGSALHNAGFSKKGASLIVLSRGGKINYWHGAVACAAGLKLDYIASEETQCGEHSHSVDLTTLRPVIRRRVKRLPFLSLKRTIGRASRAVGFSQ